MKPRSWRFIRANLLISLDLTVKQITCYCTVWKEQKERKREKTPPISGEATRKPRPKLGPELRWCCIITEQSWVESEAKADMSSATDH
jgi:hypothetical protein